MPHQLHAAERIAEAGKLILGDPPGLGKTRSILAALAKMGSERPLIVCPASVRTHWKREHLALFGAENGMIVKSYDQIVQGGLQLMAELLHRDRVDSLTLDEFHYCKSVSAQRTQLLLGKDGYAPRLQHVIPASGTPVPRSPLDLWPVLSSVFPQVVLHYGIRTRADWVNRFCVVRRFVVHGQWREKVVGVKDVETLQQILSRVMIRRSLSAIGASVPKVWWQPLRLDVAPDGETFALEFGLGAKIKAAIDAGELASIAADPQVSRLRRRLGELLVAPIVEMLRSQLADSEEKIVVFAHHKSVLHSLRESLRAFSPAYVDGDTKLRDAQVDRFAYDPTCRVFIGQQIACGTGMDGLQRSAKRVLLVEPDWVATNNVQAVARVARMGSDADNVIAQMVCVSGSLTEAILAQVKRETEMIAQTLNEGGD